AELVRLPPLILTNGASTEAIAPLVAGWAQDHDIEVIISNWPNIAEALQLMRRRVPQDIVVASLDLNPGRGPNSGMQQNHRIVGERAVEQLAILIKTNQRGLVRPPNTTLIEGEWIEGTDVPPARRAQLEGRAAKRLHSSVSTKLTARKRRVP
ncbi:MAG TPA: hypothetical protein VKC60_09880, partial [Opitutaceae bacterium]|nr:hypothetical protein [Opitutaceae bacterium]